MRSIKHTAAVTGRAKWNAATINGILSNEKYTGCARIQKTFTPDFLTKKIVKNTGQVPSYFVEQSHPAIIAPETFEMVQAEVARRKREGGRYSGVSIFSAKLSVACAAASSEPRFGTAPTSTGAPSTVATTNTTGISAGHPM